MAKQAQTQVTVSGLSRNSNSSALPAGSCAVAENVVSRRPGLLTPIPATVPMPDLTIEGFALTTGKYLWSDADTGVLAVLPAKSDSNEWVPGTNETQTAALKCYTVNQEVQTEQWSETQLPVGWVFVDPDWIYQERPIGFLPGLTHSAFSAFRTMINEKWGPIVSSSNERRWAGLPPPHIEATNGNTPGPDATYNWLLDGNSVLYRAHFLYESLDKNRPFQVVGPAGNISAAYATFDTAVDVIVNIPVNEPIVPDDPTMKVFVVVYRSTQALVESTAELPDDFRQIHKQEVTGIVGPGAVEFIDYVKDAGRNEGALIYTTNHGENANSFAPPTARDISVFRDNTFYANRSSLPAITLTVPGALLTQLNGEGLFGSYDMQHGIGTRKFAGSAVNGSNVISITAPSFDSFNGVDAGQFYEVAGSVTVRGVLSGYSPGFGFSLDAPWAGATGAVDVWLYDTYTITVEYADGDSDLTYQRVGDLQGSEFFGVSSPDPAEPIPSLRLFGTDGNYYPLPRYGATLIWIYTWPALKRVVSMSIWCSNGQNYAPEALSTEEYRFAQIDTRPNRLFFSKTGEPEAVPLANLLDIGAGTILKMAPTQSALLVLATDGLWRVTGEPPFQVNQVDPTVTLLHPDCLGTLNNQIYGWVEDGLSLIGEDGAKTISTDAVGPDIRSWATTIKGWGSPYFWGPCIAGDRFWNEIWLNVFRSATTASEHDADFITTLVYNTDTRNFTRLQYNDFSALVYSPDANRLVSQMYVHESDTDPLILVTAQGDFFSPAGEPSIGWDPALVWFNALQTEDKGKLKQWMDVNYFVANVQPVPFDATVSYLKALFDARNENNDPLATDYTVNVQSMVALSRDVHFWVPRRSALSDQQQLGLKSLVFDEDIVDFDDEHGFYFELQGFTARYRVASDTFKR